MLYSHKKFFCSLFSFVSIANLLTAENVAIIGGIDLTGAPPYAAFVSSSGSVTPINLPTGTAVITGIIQNVSMNGSGIGLIGGQETIGSNNAAFAALVSSSGTVTPLSISEPTAFHGIIYGVSINNSGNGIIGGRDTTGPIYAALVPPNGNPLIELEFPSILAAGGVINSVAINDAGVSLIGGKGFYSAQPAYAGIVSPTGSITSLVLTGSVGISGMINSVDNNNLGSGIIGGRDLIGSQPAYAALVSSSGGVTPLSLGSSLGTTGNIASVAINDAGLSIIGGQDLTGGQPAYAALISPSGSVIPLLLGTNMETSGNIASVAINDAGLSIIGGQDLTGGQPAYAALISPSGSVTPLVLGSGMDINGQVFSVAIDSLGNGIIGGWDLTGSQPAYAALFTSSGTVVPLTLTGGMAVNGWINSVAWMQEAVLPIMTQIPTQFLSGNNLIFAKYINDFIPEKALYFVPSELDGSLNAALQSAAPTRNGISTYTANNNVFFLTTSLASHIRNQQTIQYESPNAFTHVSQNGLYYDQLWASRTLSKQNLNRSNQQPNSIYFEAIGALAHQKAQHQTPSFDPTMGGAILAYDRMFAQKWRVGCGLAYLYTHVHQKEDQGKANIHQEEGFIYGSWDNQSVYVDLLLMGGGMQIKQTRHTKMTGFSFDSSSKPHGWQLIPHGELGAKKQLFKAYKKGLFDLNPFIMLDWANGWQKSYTEKGNSPFNIFQKSYYGSLLRTEAGFRFYETLFFDAWNFSVQEKLSYVNTQSFDGGRVNAFLVGSPGSFSVETLSSAQNLGVVQLALTFDPIKAAYPKVNCFYQGEFGKQYRSHQVNLELAWQF